jgi:type IV secretory pathway VirB2 component (pilin)
MKRIFLGPWAHWLILAAIVGLGWVAGLYRLHVTMFNAFIITIIIGACAVVALVIVSSPRDRQITRDPLEDDTAD